MRRKLSYPVLNRVLMALISLALIIVSAGLFRVWIAALGLETTPSDSLVKDRSNPTLSSSVVTSSSPSANIRLGDLVARIDRSSYTVLDQKD